MKKSIYLCFIGILILPRHVYATEEKIVCEEDVVPSVSQGIEPTGDFLSDYPWTKSYLGDDGKWHVLLISGADPVKPQSPYRYYTIQDESYPLYTETGDLSIRALSGQKGRAVYAKQVATLNSEPGYMISFDGQSWYWVSDKALNQDVSKGTVLLYKDGGIVSQLKHPAYQFVKNSFGDDGKIHYAIDKTNSPDSQTSNKFEKLVTQAISRWHQALGGTLFVPIRSEANADLVIQINPKNGNSTNIGMVNISEADLIKQSDEVLIRIIQHELGHSLGLDHSDGYLSDDNVMHSTLSLVNGSPKGDSQNQFDPQTLDTVRLIEANHNYSRPIIPLPSAIGDIVGDDRVEIGVSQKLTVPVLPSNSYQSISWTTSDDSLASIDDKGDILASLEGEFSITAKSLNGLTSQKTFFADYPEFKETAYHLKLGKTYKGSFYSDTDTDYFIHDNEATDKVLVSDRKFVAVFGANAMTYLEKDGKYYRYLFKDEETAIMRGKKGDHYSFSYLPISDSEARPQALVPEVHLKLGEIIRLDKVAKRGHAYPSELSANSKNISYDRVTGEITATKLGRNNLNIVDEFTQHSLTLPIIVD